MIIVQVKIRNSTRSDATRAWEADSVILPKVDMSKKHPMKESHTVESRVRKDITNYTA